MTKPLDLGPKPRLGYSGNLLKRAAERRGDPAFLASIEPNGAAYVIAGEMVILRKIAGGHDPIFSLAEARAFGEIEESVFLGLLGEAGRFGIALEPSGAEALKGRADLHVTDLRSIAVQGLVEADHLAPIAEAKALLGWHARHGFCACCGTATESVDGGWRRNCPACNAQHFPRTDPVVIMLTFTGDRCLFGRQARFPPGMWSCLAGFVEPGETIEEAVRRETHEEAGIECGRVRYFASQPWPFPSSLMIGCHAQALSHEITVDRNELEDARWFSRDEATAMLLRKHPDGLTTPPPIAIAHHLIRRWVEEGDRVLD